MRLAAYLPRLLLLGGVFLFAGATLTYGAAIRLSADTAVQPTGPVPTPTVTVTLARTGYAETGEPEDLSPYIGTAVVPAETRTVVAPKPVPTKAAPMTAKKTAAKKPGVKKPAETKTTAAETRPPAFALAGAPKEPLDE